MRGTALDEDTDDACRILLVEHTRNVALASTPPSNVTNGFSELLWVGVRVLTCVGFEDLRLMRSVFADCAAESNNGDDVALEIAGIASRGPERSRGVLRMEYQLEYNSPPPLDWSGDDPDGELTYYYELEEDTRCLRDDTGRDPVRVSRRVCVRKAAVFGGLLFEIGTHRRKLVYPEDMVDCLAHAFCASSLPMYFGDRPEWTRMRPAGAIMYMDMQRDEYWATEEAEPESSMAQCSGRGTKGWPHRGLPDRRSAARRPVLVFRVLHLLRLLWAWRCASAAWLLSGAHGAEACARGRWNVLWHSSGGAPPATSRPQSLLCRGGVPPRNLFLRGNRQDAVPHA